MVIERDTLSRWGKHLYGLVILKKNYPWQRNDRDKKSCKTTRSYNSASNGGKVMVLIHDPSSHLDEHFCKLVQNTPMQYIVLARTWQAKCDGMTDWNINGAETNEQMEQTRERTNAQITL